MSPELEEQMQRQMRQLMWLAWLIRILFYPVGLAIRAFVWLIILKHRLFPRWNPLSGGGTHPDFARLLQDLAALEPTHMRVDGDWVINDRYQCRIRLPAGAELQQSFPMPVVFGLELPGVIVSCEVLRPGELDDHFRLSPQSSVARDEPFFAGPLQARLITFAFESPHRDPWTVTNAWVQAPGRIYRFHAFPRGKEPIDHASVLRSISETFVDDRPKPDGFSAVQSQ